MITLTYEQIRNPNFVSGYQKLSRHPGYSPKVAYNMGKVCEKLENFEKKCSDLFNSTAKKYALQNEDGSLKTPEGKPPGSFEVPEEKHEEYVKEMEEIRTLNVELEYFKVPLDELQSVGLSPLEITAVDDLIDVAEPKLAAVE